MIKTGDKLLRTIRESLAEATRLASRETLSPDAVRALAAQIN